MLPNRNAVMSCVEIFSTLSKVCGFSWLISWIWSFYKEAVISSYYCFLLLETFRSFSNVQFRGTFAIQKINANVKINSVFQERWTTSLIILHFAQFFYCLQLQIWYITPKRVNCKYVLLSFVVMIYNAWNNMSKPLKSTRTCCFLSET